jgi:CBS domain containing-hemolysin-like protein
MIGFSLIVEGLGFHIPKGYLYAAIGFSILIEAANQIGRRNVIKRVTTADLRDRTAMAVLRMLRGGQSAPQASEEVAAIVSTGGGGSAFTPEESLMIEQVLSLAGRPVRSIMVPRVDVIWLDIEDTPKAILAEIRARGRSRFPVCRHDVDQIVGIVHAKDLVGRDEDELALGTALREPLYVTETMPVLRLLERFRASTLHMAIVVDEHGSFEGIVTLTDILIAIAGDMPELAGEQEPSATQREDGSWLLDGRMSIDDVERTLRTHDMQGDGDYTTLAGFALEHLGHLPEVGEGFVWEGWRFEVVALEGRRIERLLAIRE